MKILVFSDSHGMTAAMCEAALQHKPDVCLHLGDYADDADELRVLMPDVPVYAVRGNGDYSSQEPIRQELTFSGVKIFMTHGHTYRVKMDPSGLINTAMYADAKLLLYGHTHVPMWEAVGDMIVLNPGSIGYKGTYAVLEAENGTLRFALKRSGEE